MPQWDGSPPVNFSGLFSFYTTYVKTLYSTSVQQDEVPVKTLVELSIAFDHLADRWVRNSSEEYVVARAYERLVQACYAIFRLRVNKAKEQYRQLCKIDISSLDNGRFEPALQNLFNTIRSGEAEAIRLENSGLGSEKASLDQWQQVFNDCNRLEQEFYFNPSLNWAKKLGLETTIRHHLVGFIIGVLSSIVASWLWGFF